MLHREAHWEADSEPNCRILAALERSEDNLQRGGFKLRTAETKSSILKELQEGAADSEPNCIILVALERSGCASNGIVKHPLGSTVLEHCIAFPGVWKEHEAGCDNWNEWNSGSCQIRFVTFCDFCVQLGDFWQASVAAAAQAPGPRLPGVLAQGRGPLFDRGSA
eukprot:gene7743-biopygen12081